MEKKDKEKGKKIPCKACGGSGSLEPGLICGTCNGTGEVEIL